MSDLKTPFVAAAFAAFMLASSAQAAVIVADNFDDYGGANITNFSAFTHGLNLDQGTVDLVDDATNPWSLAGNGGFIDLDGSNGVAGVLRTDAFNVQAGDVITLSLQIAGNQRGGRNNLSDNWDFGFQTLGGLPFTFNNVIVTDPLHGNATYASLAGGNALGRPLDTALDWQTDWTPFSITFTAGSAATLTAYVATTSHDHMGPLLDNFLLTSTTVPEPATWAMMLTGLGTLGAMLRRRRAQGGLA